MLNEERVITRRVARRGNYHSHIRVNKAEVADRRGGVGCTQGEVMERGNRNRDWRGLADKEGDSGGG